MEKVLMAFLSRLMKINGEYRQNGNAFELETALNGLCAEYGEYSGFGDVVLNMGEELIMRGDYTAGITVIRAVNDHFSTVNNKTLLYLRMAEYCIENGNTEKGIEYLTLLCTDGPSNYEEIIEVNELTEVWLKYKHLVSGKVPASVAVNNSPKPLKPSQCTVGIKDIFELDNDEILCELSAHLAELSANGEAMNCLNEWEKTAFLADELWTEVNSGGFSGYLYYYGHHFEKAYTALEAVGACKVTSVMERARSKFPGGKMPKSIDAIMNAIDKMEEKGVDFEAEDAEFYEVGDKELSEVLLEFVLANKERFR